MDLRTRGRRGFDGTPQDRAGQPFLPLPASPTRSPWAPDAQRETERAPPLVPLSTLLRAEDPHAEGRGVQSFWFLEGTQADGRRPERTVPRRLQVTRGGLQSPRLSSGQAAA